MDASTRENLRISLLRFMDENPARFGLIVALLLTMARNEGFEVARKDIERELDYLSDKKLAASVNKPMSPENRAWKLTADGRDFLAERGIGNE